MRKTFLLGAFCMASSLLRAQCVPPSLSTPLSQTLCSGRNTSPVLFVSDSADADFSWTNNNPAIGLPASGAGDIASFIATDTSSSVPISATISVVANYGGCSSAPKTFTITVKPTPPAPVLSPYGSQLVSSSGGPGSTYQWLFYGTTIDGSYAQAFTPQQIGTYNVQVLVGGCLSEPSNTINLLVLVPLAVSNLNASGDIRSNGTLVHQRLQLRSSINHTYHAQLLSPGGARMQEKRFSGSVDLEMGQYPAGLYLLLLRDEKTGQWWQQKIVKE